MLWQQLWLASWHRVVTKKQSADAQAEGNDAVAEQTEAAPAEQTETVSATVDKENFSVVMPAGWENVNENSTSVTFKKPDPTGDAAYAGLARARVTYYKMTVDKLVSQKLSEAEKQSDRTVNGVTYSYFIDAAGNGPFFYLLTPAEGEACYEVYLEKYDADQPEIISLLESIVLK